MKNLSLIVSLLFILSSCAKEKSENVKQDSIFSIYELFYNEPMDKTTARATFRFGGPTGTLLELSDPAISNFNSDELLYNAVLGTHDKEYSGLVENGTFTYTDLDNSAFANMTPSIKKIAFNSFDSIDSEQSYTFVWEGEPLGENESAVLTIDGSKQNNLEIFTTANKGATEIILPANRLQKLGLGDASCTLVRITNIGMVDQGTSKGGRVAVWYSTKKSISIN